MKIFLNKSECLVLEHKDFKNFSIHPLWLRERINNKKFLQINAIDAIEISNKA